MHEQSTPHLPSLSSLVALHETGAHLVLLGRRETPIRQGYGKRPATRAEIVAHHRRGRPFGVRPRGHGDPLDGVDRPSIYCLDWDAADRQRELAQLRTAAPPLLDCPSLRTPGRAHLWYAARPGDPWRGDGQWGVPGARHVGEVRTGLYVTLRGSEAQLLADTRRALLTDALQPGVDPWASSVTLRPGGRPPVSQTNCHLPSLSYSPSSRHSKTHWGGLGGVSPPSPGGWCGELPRPGERDLRMWWELLHHAVSARQGMTPARVIPGMLDYDARRLYAVIPDVGGAGRQDGQPYLMSTALDQASRLAALTSCWSYRSEVQAAKGRRSGECRRRRTAKRDADICRRVRRGDRGRSIAAVYGITQQAVSYIVRRERSRQSLPEPELAPDPTPRLAPGGGHLQGSRYLVGGPMRRPSEGHAAQDGSDESPPEPEFAPDPTHGSAPGGGGGYLVRRDPPGGPARVSGPMELADNAGYLREVQAAKGRWSGESRRRRTAERDADILRRVRRGERYWSIAAVHAISFQTVGYVVWRERSRQSPPEPERSPDPTPRLDPGGSGGYLVRRIRRR